MTLANDSHAVRFQIDTIAKKHPQSNATMQDAQTMIPAGLPMRPIRAHHVNLVCDISIGPDALYGSRCSQLSTLELLPVKNSVSSIANS